MSNPARVDAHRALIAAKLVGLLFGRAGAAGTRCRLDLAFKPRAVVNKGPKRRWLAHCRPVISAARPRRA